MARKRSAPQEAKAEDLVTQEAEEAKADSGMKRYVGTRVSMFHPFERVHISRAMPGVMLDPKDSWVASQVQAGLLKEV